MSDEKTKAVIERHLKTEERREAFFQFVETHNLVEAQEELRGAYKMAVAPSINTISRWAEKRRRANDDLKFIQLIGEIKDDADRAQTFAKEIGDAQKLTEANVTMLSQALFRASRTKEPKAMKSSATLLSMLLEAVAKQNASRASVISAETARSRFQFDAAKAALAAAGDLQQIQKSKGSEREKVERAVTRLFGAKPKGT